MNLQLILPDELAQRLSTVAAKRGRAAENCAIELLDQSLPSMEKKQAVSKMLLEWSIKSMRCLKKKWM
jgi:plasmid stability protein